MFTVFPGSSKAVDIEGLFFKHFGLHKSKTVFNKRKKDRTGRQDR